MRERIYVTVGKFSEPHGYHKGALLRGFPMSNPQWREKLRKHRQSLMEKSSVSTLENIPNVKTTRLSVHKGTAKVSDAASRSRKCA